MSWRGPVRRIITEWLTTGQAKVHAPSALKESVADERTFNELALAFLTKHADSYYHHADGTPTGEAQNFEDAPRPLTRLYGRTQAGSFGPRFLKAVRNAMIEAGLARSTIKARIGKIVRVFSWAVENEPVPPSVHHGLRSVSGLKEGRSGARTLSQIPKKELTAAQRVESKAWCPEQTRHPNQRRSTRRSPTRWRILRRRVPSEHQETVEAGLSYDEVKRLLKIPSTRGAKIKSERFRERATKHLEERPSS